MTHEARPWQHQPLETGELPLETNPDRRMHEAHSAGSFVRQRPSSGPSPLLIGLAVALVASLSGVGILAYNLSTAKEAALQEARRADEKAQQAQKAAQAEKNAAENARLAQQRFQQAKTTADRTLQNERRFQPMGGGQPANPVRHTNPAG